jgi:hypothetical protein
MYQTDDDMIFLHKWLCTLKWFLGIQSSHMNSRYDILTMISIVYEYECFLGLILLCLFL